MEYYRSEVLFELSKLGYSNMEIIKFIENYAELIEYHYGQHHDAEICATAIETAHVVSKLMIA